MKKLRRDFCKVLAMLCCICALFGSAIAQEDGQPEEFVSASGEYRYTVNADGEAVLVQYLGTGGMVMLPEELDGYPVTGIKIFAFRDAAVLAIYIPDTLTWIEGGAFAQCEALYMLYVENSHPVYGLIDGVLYDKQTRTLHTCIPAMCPRRFLIPEGILAIGDRAFSGCEGLAEIRIPQGLETIGGYAFSMCEGLGAVELPQSVTSIGTAAFFSSGIARVNLPEGLAVLGDHAFALCQNLQSISLPSSLRCIAGSTFLHSGLNNCTFAEGLVEIGEYAFAYCYNLGRVQLPESIESIGASAFYECNNMPDFRIPVGVTQIGPGAFGSTDLTDVAIAEGNDVYGMRDGALYDLRTDTLHTCFEENEPVEFHIPDGTRAIGANAFDGCSKLEKVVIPDSVESIGDKAFSSCYALVRLTIPAGVREIGQSTVSYSGVSAFEVAEDNPAFEQIDGVLFEKKSHTLHTFPPEWGKEYTAPEETEIIGEGAFQSVSDLQRLTIPEGVRTIERNAFSYSGLEELYLPESVAYIAPDALKYCSKVKLWVVEDSYAATFAQENELNYSARPDWL